MTNQIIFRRIRIYQPMNITFYSFLNILHYPQLFNYYSSSPMSNQLIVQQLDYAFFLFVNTKSGGKKGNRFIHLQIETVKFKLNQSTVCVNFYDFVNETQRLKGLKKLQQTVQKKIRARVIVCGGDGSVLWIIKQIVSFKIDINQIPIGILPIGTGNDFSRNLGWGGQQRQMIGKKFEKLKSLILLWMSAAIQSFDVWEMRFSVFQEGYLKRMNNTGISQPLSQSQYSNRCFVKSFTNYCSFGGDGRVGYSFDKYRTNSRFLNLLLYAGIGLAKSCKTLQKIETYVENMQIINDDNIHMNSQSIKIKSVNTTTDKLNESHQNRNKSKVFDNSSQDSSIEKGFQNFLALNINSFMGGANGMWQSKKIGVKKYQNQYLPQKYNDGLLEFLSWKSEMSLGLEKLYNNGSKITQGKGPFIINFKQFKNSDFYTYLQIDGQYFKVYHPKSLLIQKSTLVPNGTIKVLRNTAQ